MPKSRKFGVENLLNKKLMVILFRWIIILISAILLYYKRGVFQIDDPAVLLLIFLICSNGILTFIKQHFFEQPKYLFLILFADIISISILFRFMSSEHHLYIVFFAVLFISSISQNVKWSLLVAFIATTFYLSIISLGKTSIWTVLITNPEVSIKIPFIFLIAIWTSFWSEQYRKKKEEEEKIKQFNKELEQGIRIATEKEHRVSQDLKKMKEYSENILKSLNSGIIVVNKHGIITTANPKAKKIIDPQFCNLIGKQYTEIEEFEPFMDILRTALQRGKKNGIHEIVLRNGKILNMTFSPLQESDQESGVTFVFQDITAVKKMKEKVRQSESLANLGKTIAWIAHEIRNSLTNIKGFAQLIEMKYSNNGDMKEFLLPLIKSTDKISIFMTDILDFSKNRSIKKQAVSINNILNELEESFKNSLNGTKLRIEREFVDDLLISNQEALNCIISNLIRNAKESIEENGGHGTIELYARRINHHAIFEVSDTGKGIDAEAITSIFDPFYTTKKNGTGLGLSIVKKIVESLDGEITVKNKPGSGTTFTISIPAFN